MVTLSTLAAALGALLADTLAPPACAACSERLDRRAVFCRPCAAAVEPAGPGLVVAAAVYGGPVARALHRLKYEDRPDLASPLGALLRRAVRASRLQADVVVPVPLHPTRLAERGYNQAALLAAAAARELPCPVEPRAVVRRRPTVQQAHLTRARRLENVAGAFTPGPRASAVHGRRVLLVDDVATTGATIAACARALRDAGAISVTPIVVARAERAEDGS